MRPPQPAFFRDDREAQLYLQIGAIVGRRFSMIVVAYAAGADIETTHRVLQRSAAAGVIDRVPGSRYHFAYRHALLQRAFAGTISETNRRRLHRRVLRALETVAPDESTDDVLAYHAFESALRGKMRLYGERAGDRALLVGAATEAERYYAVALSAARAPGAQERLRRKLRTAQGALNPSP